MVWPMVFPEDLMQGALYHDHLCGGVSTGFSDGKLHQKASAAVEKPALHIYRRPGMVPGRLHCHGHEPDAGQKRLSVHEI